MSYLSGASQDVAEIGGLVIDLNKAQQATPLEANSILHKTQLDSFLGRIEQVVERVDEFKKSLNHNASNSSGVGYVRYHDVITVHGKRGSGKTTFLLSALTALQGNAEAHRNSSDGLDNLCILEIMDPTLFGLHDHLLHTLLGKITQKVRLHSSRCGVALCSSHSDPCAMEKWENSLSNLAKGLKYIGEARDDLKTPLPGEAVHWEDAEFLLEKGMDSARCGFELERQFHHFLNDSLNILGKKAFVLALDDIDTRPAIGWHVLEVLRRYFTSPQLVVIISGDMDLFRILIEKQQLSIFGLDFTTNASVLKAFKPRVDGLTEQYLLKILRTQNRINLGSFQTALQQWESIESGAKACVTQGPKKLSLDDLLSTQFYKELACHTVAEQKIFRQALYANSTRSVVQVLDGLMESAMAESFKDLVGRLREVFFVSLQNIGFEQPHTLPELLQTPQGITAIMKQLFTRGFVENGLDLLPASSSEDKNNALLALHTVLTRAMHDKVTVFFCYALKACLLRQVLALKGEEVNTVTYARMTTYLSLEAKELPSMTASRISALNWGRLAASTLIRSVGLVRLYAGSITKSAPDALKSMYGSTIAAELSKRAEKDSKISLTDFPPELQTFCEVAQKSDLNPAYTKMRRWINTPETLQDTIKSWQKDIVNLGVIDVEAEGKKNRAFSIFPLLGAMQDILECEQENMVSLLLQYSRIPCFAIYDPLSEKGKPSTDPMEQDEIADADERDKVQESSAEESEKNKFIKAVQEWQEDCARVRRDKLFLPPTLCARVMVRFFHALGGIITSTSNTNNNTFIGKYVHRCLVAFFNSVLVEEFLLSGVKATNAKVLLQNPTAADDNFIENIKQMQSIIIPFEDKRHALNGKKIEEVSFTTSDEKDDASRKQDFDGLPFFKMVFSCPLWGLYLNPDIDTDQSVYSRYIELQKKKMGDMEGVYKVTYNKEGSTFTNLYPALNSLAIPKLK